MCGHPDPFRTVRDLGLVLARCSCQSGITHSRSSWWLPAWLPSKTTVCPPGSPAADRRVRAGRLPARRWSVSAALSPIGLTAAGLFAAGEVSRADSRVRSAGTFTCARWPAARSALDVVAEAYHNPAAVWWWALSVRRPAGQGGDWFVPCFLIGAWFAGRAARGQGGAPCGRTTLTPRWPARIMARRGSEGALVRASQRRLRSGRAVKPRGAGSCRRRAPSLILVRGAGAWLRRHDA
jgi:hypothetical protein